MLVWAPCLLVRGPGAPSSSLMLLLITVMCVIAEKKLQLNRTSLRCRNFYHWCYFNWGGGGPPAPPPPLATPMLPQSLQLRKLRCGLTLLKFVAD